MAAELGSTSEPTELIPGAPESIEADIAALYSKSRDVDAVGENLKRVDTGAWRGQASVAFQDAFAAEPPKWLRTGDTLEASATALDNYVETLRWAQSQASEAMRCWEEGNAATKQAEQDHDDAVARADAAAAAGSPPAEPVPEFTDAGAELRQEAQEILDRARTQLDEVGNTTCDMIAGDGQRGDGGGWLSDIGASLAGIGGVIAGAGTSVAGAIAPDAINTEGNAEFNGPNAGAEASGPDADELSLGSANAHANLVDTSAEGELSSGDFTASGDAEASLGTQASAAAGITDSGLEANASARAGLHAGASGEASYGPATVGANADGFAGAEAGASASLGSDGLNLGAEGFAGARASADAHADVAGVGAGANAEAWAGAGAEADLDVGYDDGKITLGGHVGAALGVGGSVGGEITIDPGEVVDTASDAAQAVGDTASDVAGAVGDTASETWDKVSFWN